jgi:hypothetical protein
MIRVKGVDWKYDGNYLICKDCEEEKYWYFFPTAKGRVISNRCCVCTTKKNKQKALSNIRILIMAAEKNKMSDLRAHLFECLEMVKAKAMTNEEAKSACMIAQTIINSAKVEIDFIKLIGGTKRSEFFQIEPPNEVEK